MLRSTGDIRQAYYRNNIDFERLASCDSRFGELYAARGRLDWRDPIVVQELTQALLRQDFGLTLTLPDDRLCPPVPVRWNYIRWLQDLLDGTRTESVDDANATDTLTGLDIGTGASSIYSILACASRSNCHMIATDIDDKSLSFARQNVHNNHFDQNITLKQTTIDDSVIPLDAFGLDSIDFVVCNPPFYSSVDDMDAAYGGKDMPPSAVCTGSANEMICDGGDIGFASRIFDESQKLRTRVRWFSCMLCRLVSAKLLVEKIKGAGINNFAAANLQAGQKTVRWAIAWSYGDLRPLTDVVRHGSLVAALLAPATERTILAPKMTGQELWHKVHEKMQHLDLEWAPRSDSNSGTALTSKNVWSRSARRQPGIQHNSEAIGQRRVDKPMLEVTLACLDGQVMMRWRRGHDMLLFESFCGMIRQVLGQRRGLR